MDYSCGCNRQRLEPPRLRLIPTRCLLPESAGGRDVGIVCGNGGEADNAEVVGIVGVSRRFVAAENTPAAVVFKYWGLAVEEAGGLALFDDGVVTAAIEAAAMFGQICSWS